MEAGVTGLRVIGIMAVVSVLALGAKTPLDQAHELYHCTEYEAALKLLLPLEKKAGPEWALVG